MKKELLTIKQNFLKRLMVLVDALIFLQHAFAIAEKDKDNALSSAINELKKYIPNGLKAIENEEVKDYHLLFVSMIFLQLVSLMELFLVDVISCIVRRYPQKIGDVNLKLSDIIDIENKDKMIEKACGDYLNNLMYKRPNEYKKEIIEIISARKDLLDDVWPQFVEIKARRDVAVHNDWIANETYIRKAREVGVNNDIQVGDSLYPDFGYYFNASELYQKMVETIISHLVLRFRTV